ncbi:MAG: SIMPL domain-containing protein, partial [Parachlamydiaceae bacterium]
MKYLIFLFALALHAEEVATLTVNGQGQIVSIADESRISLAVVSEANSASKAAQVNRETMAKALEAIRSLGFEANEIKTGQYLVRPVYSTSKEGIRSLQGYEARNSIEIRSPKLNLIGQLIDKATASGVNEISDLQFTLSEPEKARLEAIQKAISQAKQEAIEAAKAAGVELKKVKEIKIEPSGRPGPLFKAMAYQ